MEETGASRRHIAGAMLGIALEVYDFIIYAYFAVYISRSLFPSASSYVGLLLTLATFGIGFVARPLGALLIGRYADRKGRRPAMVLSFLLMGAGILLLACTPPYQLVGFLAPLMALCARLMQGFALGGEVGSTTAFLLEAAPPHRRGLYCSLQYAGQGAAAIVAGLVGFTLAELLEPADLESYGWRIAFLLGVAVLPVGLALRRSLPETLPRAAAGAPTPSLPRRIVFLGVLALGSSAVVSYVTHYMTTYAIHTLHLSARIAFLAPVITGFVVVVGSIASGAASDVIGRKPLMIVPPLLSLLLILPVFRAMVTTPSALVFLGGLFVLGLALDGATMLTCFSEALPAEQRSTGIALVYAVAVALFGGTAQVVVTWLIHETGSAMAPAWYLMVACFLGLIARLLLPETAPRRLEARRVARA
jgi:MFS transporter, MHS family, citrate/tricarballylate:H+ symporter